ncbi:MAG: hypothetical protein WDN49_03410 [Acetobacteraceae bacterium]
MAQKKDRAFIVCPRWSEVADAPRAGASRHGGADPHPSRHPGAIKAGRPVARSTLRKALVAARQATGAMFDVDAYMVDQRTAASR